MPQLQLHAQNLLFNGIGFRQIGLLYFMDTSRKGQTSKFNEVKKYKIAQLIEKLRMIYTNMLVVPEQLTERSKQKHTKNSDTETFRRWQSGRDEKSNNRINLTEIRSTKENKMR